MKMKDFSKTLLVIMVGTMGVSSCADSWEEMRKEKYEKEWVKTFGEVDPNHTWNLATQVTADLAIKEDALTEYTFKVYTSDPIWGTDAKLLAKATVKTDEVGYAETQIKFDAPSSMETYYITRTDSHGRRLLKVSDIENKKIEVKFGIATGNVGNRALHHASFDSLKIENPYTEEWVNQQIQDDNIPVIKTGDNKSIINLGGTVKATASLPKGSKGYTFNGESSSNKSILIIAGDSIIFEDQNQVSVNNYNKEYFSNIDIIIAPNSSLILKKGIQLGTNARVFIMKGGTLNAYPGFYDNEFQKVSIDVEAQSSLLYNAGLLNFDFIRVQQGTLYNAETGIIPGIGDDSDDTRPNEVVISCSNDAGTITNFGKIKVNRIVGNKDVNENNSAVGSQQQGTLNNGCFIDIRERICIKYLNVNSNSTIESYDIVVNQITARENSIIRSTLFSAQNGQKTTTWFYKGIDGGKSLISSDTVSYIANIGVVGEIYFETNHYSRSDNGFNKIKEAYGYDVSGGAYGEKGSFPILILPDHDYNGDDVSKYDCVGHGNIPQEFETIVDKEIEWAIAFEDLGDIGDYDFNDVVIGVSQDSTKAKIKVTALAAGGTIAADVYYKEERLGEIHELLNRTETDVPVNVLNYRDEESGRRKIYEIDPENFSIENNWTDFSIRINGQASAILRPLEAKSKSNIPQAICIPSDWLWPKEGINIKEAYTGFANWVENQENYKNWYMNHTEGKVALSKNQ